MGETTKSLLIVGAVAAGAYLLAKVALKPSTPSSGGHSASAGDFLQLGGLAAALINPLAGIFGPSSSTPIPGSVVNGVGVTSSGGLIDVDTDILT